MMKRQISYTICAAAMLLAACAKDNAPQPAPDTGAQLSIAIFDGGYAPAGGVRPAASNASEPGTAAAGAFKAPATRAADAPITRAAENGYATQFTAGDRCGLYIMRDGVVTAANVTLTASEGSGGAFVWTPDASAGTLWFTPGDRYFVYYPWQAAPQGAPAAGQRVDADDDAAFFAALIASWEPAADQSDYAASYTAYDLMTAEATVGDSAGGNVPLSFEMTHRMALVVVELPGTISLDGDIESVTAAFSGEAQPCRMADHTYRYLVHPAVPIYPTLEGTYDEGTREFAIVLSGIEAGSCKTYKVDGGITEETTLQVGDYFFSDGSHSARLNPKKTVIGIVFQINPDRIGEAEKKALKEKGVDTPRGLVMAVKNAGTNLAWGPYELVEGLTYCDTEEDNNNDISGYGNCQQIRKIYGDFDKFPAFKAADAYNTTCPAPETTTGWYLPASGQWYDILHNLGGLEAWRAADSFASDFDWYDQEVSDVLNNRLSSVTDADELNNGFWSSSAYGDYYARDWGVNGGSVYCHWTDKGNGMSVRPVLAF